MTSNLIQPSTYHWIKEHLNPAIVDLHTGTLLEGSLNQDSDGYLYTILAGKIIRQHHIVAFCIYGERMIGKQVNHLNGQKNDNRPVNLELVTASENVRHAFSTGLKKARRGEDSPSSKLTEQDVIKIRKLRKDGLTLSKIASQFGVQFQQISKICNGDRWGHVTSDLILPEELVDLDFDGYQELAVRTTNKSLDEWEAFCNYSLGLVAESAEVSDELKKVLFHGHPFDQEKIKDELSDVLWYAANLANRSQLTLKEIAAHNIVKLQNRYPKGFEMERSINRG